MPAMIPGRPILSVLNRKFLPVLFLACAVILYSCASRPPATPAAALSVLGTGADWYLVLPVAENRAFLDHLAVSSGNTGSLDNAFDRTTVMFAGFYPDRSIRLLASGSYPRSASSLVFSSSKGWKRVSGESGLSWYSGESGQAAIPVNNILVGSTGPVEPMLERMKYPALQEVVSLPAAFDQYAQNPVSGKAAIYVANPQPFIGLILGSGIELPVSSASLYFDPSDTEEGLSYTVSITLHMSDERAARLSIPLIRVLSGNEPSRNGLDVQLAPIRIAGDYIADFIGFLYF